MSNLIIISYNSLIIRFIKHIIIYKIHNTLQVISTV